MARWPRISGSKEVKAFSKDGWLMVSQPGSQVIMVKPGYMVTLSVPKHRELDRGPLRKLIRLAGLSVDEFVELLRR